MSERNVNDAYWSEMVNHQTLIFMSDGPDGFWASVDRVSKGWRGFAGWSHGLVRNDVLLFMFTGNRHSMLMHDGLNTLEEAKIAAEWMYAGLVANMAESVAKKLGGAL